MTPEELFHAHIGLAKWFANKYTRVEEYDDLFQAACLGLWEACCTWDESKGDLATVARFRMRHQVQKYLHDAGLIYGAHDKKREINNRFVSLEEEIEGSGRDRIY